MPLNAFEGRNFAVSTMHGKEKVIAPVLKQKLDMTGVVPAGLNTDRLGTFLGDIERPGSMRTTLIRKAELGLQVSGLDISVANEGSFGPHPIVPYITIGTELIALIDRKLGIQLIERITDPGPMARSWVVKDLEEISCVPKRIGFPRQGVIVFADRKTPSLYVEKDFENESELERAIQEARQKSPDGKVCVETDFRAHKNPRRLSIISKLTQKLADRLLQECPSCRKPGWGKDSTVYGAPCKICSTPTYDAQKDVFSCLSCGHREDIYSCMHSERADPGLCLVCNP